MHGQHKLNLVYFISFLSPFWGMYYKGGRVGQERLGSDSEKAAFMYNSQTFNKNTMLGKRLGQRKERNKTVNAGC